MQIKLGFLYPGSTGRNVDEVMRVLDALQKAAKHRIATPVNWKPGELVVIQPGVSDDEAKQLFPQGFQTVALPSNKSYLRFTQLWSSHNFYSPLDEVVAAITDFIRLQKSSANKIHWVLNYENNIMK